MYLRGVCGSPFSSGRKLTPLIRSCGDKLAAASSVGPRSSLLISARLLVEECRDLRRHLVIGAGVQKIDPLGERPQVMLVVDFCNGVIDASRGGPVEMKGAAADAREITALLAQDFGKRDLVSRQR